MMAWLMRTLEDPAKAKEVAEKECQEEKMDLT